MAISSKDMQLIGSADPVLAGSVCLSCYPTSVLFLCKLCLQLYKLHIFISALCHLKIDLFNFVPY